MHTITYPFTNPANYTFDSARVELTGSQAELRPVTGAPAGFVQDFDSDAGFTYDTAAAEFTGGAVQQKATVYADEMCGISVVINADADRAVGSKTATALNGAALATVGVQQYLDVTGSVNGKAWSYDPADADFKTEGAVRFKIVPDYTGTPGGNRVLFNLTGPTDNNRIEILHRSSGELKANVYNTAGALTSSVTIETVFNSVLGQEYEFEADFDFVAGTGIYFLDGLKLTGETTGQIFARGSITEFTLGSSTIASDYFFRDVQIFDSVQHTTDFPSEVPRFVPNYQGSLVELPAFIYGGVGDIDVFNAFVTTETGAPGYIIDGDYWDGAAWSASNLTYAQSSSAADVAANIGALVPGNTVVVEAVFDATTTINNIDNLVINYTGQIYPTDNPTVTPTGETSMDAFLDLVTIEDVVSSDEIRYTMAVDSVEKYHDGAAWVDSSGYAQTNTAAEVAAFADSLLTVGALVQFVAYLHSDDGTTTPGLDEVQVTYDPYFPPGPDPSLCTLYGILVDSKGMPMEGATVAAKPDQSCAGVDPAFVISRRTVSTLTDAAGAFELDLVRSVVTEPNLTYEILIQSSTGGDLCKKIRQVIPDQESVAFNDL